MNKYLRTLNINNENTSQFKEFNCEKEITPLQARMYFLMLHGSSLRGEDESLYGWCGRIGLSNSTIFGIFKKNNKNMHKSVAEKIANATGANPAWLATGIGEPFAKIETQTSKSTNRKGLNNEKLTKALETAERALEITNSTMKPEQYAAFIATLYFTEQSNEEDQNLLIACTKLIQTALKETRRAMSPSSKSQLISVIYSHYIDEHWNYQLIASTLDQLIKSVD